MERTTQIIIVAVVCAGIFLWIVLSGIKESDRIKAEGKR